MAYEEERFSKKKDEFTKDIELKVIYEENISLMRSWSSSLGEASNKEILIT